MSGRVTVLKPESSAFTEYVPVGGDGTVYSPFESVLTTRTRPVPVLVSVTVAPGMTAPVESVISPMMVPVTACAARPPGNRHATTTRPSTALFTFVLHAPATRRGTRRQVLRLALPDRWKSRRRRRGRRPRRHCPPAPPASADWGRPR